MTFEPETSVRALAAARCLHIVESSAQAGLIELRDNLSGEGSGVKYQKYPNRSAAPDEMPAFQFGRLSGALDARQIDDDMFGVGVFAEDDPDVAQQAFDLEYDPPQIGGRPFLARTMLSQETRRQLLAGAKDAL